MQRDSGVMIYLGFFVFPSRHLTKSPLRCNHGSTLVKPQYTFSFLYFRCKFYSCEFSASSGNILKPKGHGGHGL
jgi:hypothetical protein